jgi:hypothetical protein
MTFIVVQSSLGIRYFDHLISVLGSLPGLSFYVAAPGLSERIVVTPGLGTAWTKFIGTFCSLLVFGTLLGFLQRNRALRRMIERLLLQPVDAPIEALLRRRLLRAPSIVKRELRDAFLAEADDARKLRLLAIALEKRSFTAPIYFLLAFSQLSPIVRDNGAAMVRCLRRAPHPSHLPADTMRDSAGVLHRVPCRAFRIRPICAGLLQSRCPAWSIYSDGVDRWGGLEAVATAAVAT